MQTNAHSSETAPQSVPARSREESFKRWLAVLIAFVTMLVGMTSFMQADASGRNARLNRLAQESAIASTGLRARGQQQFAFAEYVVSREYDQMRSQSERLAEHGESLAARAYITASQQITPLSPLMGSGYEIILADARPYRDYNRFEVDTWVITSTLLSQRRELAAAEANAWDGKSNNYVAAIAIWAVVLFLFGLSLTLGGFVRWMFLVLGLALMAVSMLSVLITVLLPIHHVPDRALQKYAQGYGLSWQSKYDEAAKLYSEAIDADRDYANAYNERGFAYLRAGPPKLSEAIRDFQSAISKGSDKYELYWNFGWAYYLAGDYQKSIPYSQKALELNSKVCGPAFNAALVHLASGNGSEADKAYESAIARCEQILKESLAAGLGAPWTLWLDMQGSADDIDNLLCQTHQRHCFEARDKPEIRSVGNRGVVATLGETYRRRIKEALTSLEFKYSASVKPTGAKLEPLRFGNKSYDEKGQFQSYVERERFPNDGNNIYALWNYTGMSRNLNTVWKVFYNGKDETGLRYVEPWVLDVDSSAEKKINSRLSLSAGHYDVEIYGDGELLSSGSFDVDQEATLAVPPTARTTPSASVSVGNMLLADDFENNNHGWWTGTVDRGRDGKIANGEYTVVTHRKDDLWRVTCMMCGNLDNVYYEVSTRYVAGPGDWGYGLTLRSNKAMDDVYLFLISGDGQYTIGKVVGGKYASLVDWTRNNAVRQRATNRLGLLARGSSLEFFVNGQSIRRLNDSSLATGYVGMSVEHAELEVAFSQMRVWQAR